MEAEVQVLGDLSIGKMLKGLSVLSQEERKVRNETYQEYQLLSVNNVKKNFLTSLHKLYEQGMQSKLLNNIVKNHNKYFSCILAYSEQINQIIDEASFFTFSHKNFVSESALLAFYLAKEWKKKVVLVISEDSLINISHMIAGEGEQDKISFTKSALVKEGVELLRLDDWQRGGITLANEAVVVVDIFGLSPTVYSPFLLKNYDILSKVSKALIYHSHLQNEQVAQFLTKLSAETFPIQLWTDHPCQYICSKDEQTLINQLIDFLKQDLNHPEKQDIVIFYPIDQHIKRFNARLNEHLSKAGLKDYVTTITKPHLRQTNSKNNIFLVQSTQQLLNWNYDYANVLYVIDYGKESKLCYNYQLCTYVEQNTLVSTTQKAKRQSLVGNHHFGIYACLPSGELQRSNYLDAANDITSYLLRMIDYQLTNYLDLKNQRVILAINLLKKLCIITSQGESFSIIDQQSITFAKNGISPIQSKFISIFSKDTTLSKKEYERYTNLAIFMMIFLHTKESIKKVKHDVQAFMKTKPTEIWRKSGYIESCIAVITSCEAAQISVTRESESESFRRNSSKMEQSQTDPFGSFYQLIEGAQGEESSEKLSIPTFLQQNSIDQDIFFRIREEIDHYRQVFSVPKVSIIFSKEDFIKILKEYANYFKESLLFYTGYLRKGYQSESLKFKNEYIQINTESLKKELNIKPLFISALRYQINNGNQEISIWNSVSETVYLEVVGSLPIIEKQSKGETEIQFHGISSLLFERLWRNNGVQMVRFQQENNCFVQPNHEVAMVFIHCDKERSNEIKIKFQKILERIKDSISASNRLTHYVGNMKFYQGAGGIVKELVFGDYISKGLLENLHLQTTREDLEELIQEFIVVRDINMRLPEPGKQTKSAVIYFNSQRDYYTFYQCFNECMYCGYQLRITPMKKSRQQFAWEKQYIEFKWYVWQTHNKALIRFADEQSAKKALESLADPTLDGVKVQPTLQGKNLMIDNLHDITDEIFLEDVFKTYGNILQVEILKTPLREGLNDNLALQNLIYGAIQSKAFRMETIERGKSGLRSCIVTFDSFEDLMKVAGKYHKTVGLLGQNRLYAFTHFQRSMQVSDSLKNVAQSLVEEIIEEHEHLKIITSELFRYEFIGEQMIYYSPDKTILDRYYNQISTRMKGSNIKLKKAQKNLIFNEIGFANLLDLQEKYNCKLIINIASQTLSAICRGKQFESLSKEIIMRIINSFFYKIYLNSKSYNHFKINPEKLTEIKNKYQLKLVELEGEEQSIIIEGNIINVQNANTYFMYYIESLNKQEEQRVHSDVCGICCEEPKNSYRLQSCFHRFCVVCMQTYIRNILGDRSQFPIKCPHCSQLIIVEDLNLILDKTQWQKLETMALNQYIADNSDKMGFCYTAGCKEINIINGLVWNCPTCKFTYCNKCKEVTHPGYTCDQAIQIRQTDAYFMRYMAENGIRKCPNANCRMPVVKIDGCNKVLCSRCGKSMCFKCKPEEMIAYDTPQLAYDHLNQVHGGYW